MVDRSRHEPLYLQIRLDIEKKIIDGTINVGDKLMSESEMIAYYKVGRVTIRAALAELVSQGILRKEQGLGTFCAKVPQAIEPKCIDVLLDMHNTYFVPYFLSGINRTLKDYNYEIRIHDTEDSTETIATILNRIRINQTDGIILQPYTGREAPTEECVQAVLSCQNDQIPIITIDGKFRGIETPCVMNDDICGGYLAAQHLIQNGHKKILGLFRMRYKDSEFRRVGYEKAMKEAGLEPQLLDADTASSEQIVAAVKEEGITAIVCYNDLLALDCYHLCAKVGLVVGEDISIVGYDNTVLAESTLPQMTSVTHPKESMGVKVAGILLEMMNGTVQNSYRFMYTPNMVERASVKNLNRL